MTAPVRAAPMRAPTALFTAKVTLFGPRLMHEAGLTALQAAGVFGNAGHESGGFRLLQEIAPQGGAGGWGWFQETGPRRTAMLAWCRARHLDPASDEANYGYLLQELRSTEAAALRALKACTTLEAATETFCRLFERPGVVAMPDRLVWAGRALAAIEAGRAAHAAELQITAPLPLIRPWPNPAPWSRFGNWLAGLLMRPWVA